MKFANLQAFENHLRNAAPDHFADLYLAQSKEELDRESALELAKEYLLKGEKTPEMCLKSFDGETLEFEALLEELHTLPFFTKRKVIVVRRVDRLAKADLKRLEAAISQLPRAVKVVMTATDFTASHTFYKKAELAGVIVDMPVKKGAAKETELIAWVEQRCKRLGKTIDRKGSTLLVKQIAEAAHLQLELDKVACYVGDRPAITDQDIEAVCTVTPIESIWALGEAIMRVDAAGALRVGMSLLDQGSALLSLMGQIRYQLQTGFQVCSVLDSGAPPQEITKLFPHMVGGLLDKQCRAARQYGRERFKRGLVALATAEVQAKDSSLEADFILERLLLQLTR